MSASRVRDLLASLKKPVPKPVYWLEGEEDFFIDQVVEAAEALLDESQAAFNLHVLYGRDTDASAVINACRRYPVFADRQVVVLREAQVMRDVEKLQGYMEQPAPTTILVVAYRGKKLDARKSFAKAVAKAAEVLTTKRLGDKDLVQWIAAKAEEVKVILSPRQTTLLADQIGSDLGRIVNELEKLRTNVPPGQKVSDADIEAYIGISKEYNVFELQDAVMRRDFPKALRIAQYFEKDPKAAPLMMILPTLYGLFSKILLFTRGSGGASGVPPFRFKDYENAARLYGAEGSEGAVLLLHRYNLKAIGMGSVNTSDAELLKELLSRLMLA